MRIVFCIPLFIVEPFSFKFFTIYTFCGLTDVLDGYLARTLNVNSGFGAKLDSLADLIFFSVLMLVLLLNIKFPLWGFIWILIIAFVKVTSIFIGYRKYKAIYSLHTYANKITGFFLFCIPLFYSFLGVTATAIIVCVLASCSAIEELAINFSSNELKLDIKSIF